MARSWQSLLWTTKRKREIEQIRIKLDLLAKSLTKHGWQLQKGVTDDLFDEIEDWVDEMQRIKTDIRNEIEKRKGKANHVEIENVEDELRGSGDQSPG